MPRVVLILLMLGWHGRSLDRSESKTAESAEDFIRTHLFSGIIRISSNREFGIELLSVSYNFCCIRLYICRYSFGLDKY